MKLSTTESPCRPRPLKFAKIFASSVAPLGTSPGGAPFVFLSETCTSLPIWLYRPVEGTPTYPCPSTGAHPKTLIVLSAVGVFFRAQNPAKIPHAARQPQESRHQRYYRHAGDQHKPQNPRSTQPK